MQSNLFTDVFIFENGWKRSIKGSRLLREKPRETILHSELYHSTKDNPQRVLQHNDPGNTAASQSALTSSLSYATE